MSTASRGLFVVWTTLTVFHYHNFHLHMNNWIKLSHITVVEVVKFLYLVCICSFWCTVCVAVTQLWAILRKNKCIFIYLHLMNSCVEHELIVLFLASIMVYSVAQHLYPHLGINMNYRVCDFQLHSMFVYDQKLLFFNLQQKQLQGLVETGLGYYVICNNPL